MQLLTVEALYEDDARRREAEEIRIVVLEAQVSSCISVIPLPRLMRDAGTGAIPWAMAVPWIRAASLNDALGPVGLCQMNPVDICQQQFKGACVLACSVLVSGRRACPGHAAMLRRMPCCAGGGAVSPRRTPHKKLGQVLPSTYRRAAQKDV